MIPGGSDAKSLGDDCQTIDGTGVKINDKYSLLLPTQ